MTENEKKPPKLHDTHVHLEMWLEHLGFFNQIRQNNLENLADLQLSLAAESKLQEELSSHELVIHSTVSWQNFALVSRLFESFGQVKFLFGAHPELVKEGFELQQFLKQQRYFLQQEIFVQSFFQKKLVGIGECGLDYHYTQDKNLKKIQKELFESQIRLAIDLKLPLVIHCREAFDDLFEILQQFREIWGNFLIHCFTGGISEIKQVLKLGGKVAFGGILTYKKATQIQEAAVFCPQDSFVLETDLPFLAPTPYRGQVCKPSHITLIAQGMANLCNQSYEEIWQHSRFNLQKLFDI